MSKVPVFRNCCCALLVRDQLTKPANPERGSLVRGGRDDLSAVTPKREEVGSITKRVAAVVRAAEPFRATWPKPVLRQFVVGCREFDDGYIQMAGR
jgi:hypothetical protein